MIFQYDKREMSNPEIWRLWEVSSVSESVRLLPQQAENSTSGWDHSENDLRLVPGFQRQRSGMFPERFRRMSECLYLWVQKKFV